MEREFKVGDHVCVSEWSTEYCGAYRGKVGVIKRDVLKGKYGVELVGYRNHNSYYGYFWFDTKNLIPKEEMDKKKVLVGNLKTGYSYVTLNEAEENYMKNDMELIEDFKDRKLMEDFQDTLTKMFLYSEHNNIMLRNKSVEITKVIFNNPATIVFWSDSKKTVVKCGSNEAFDEEKGLAMAISKRVLGNNGNYYNEFKKWLPKIDIYEDGVPFKDTVEAFDGFGKSIRISKEDKK